MAVSAGRFTGGSTLDIIIKTIAHKGRRYPTAGDWFFDREDNLRIMVSEMGDWKKEALVAFHELKEALLCKAHGVSQEAVDAFDNSPEGQASDEPGEEAAAPYHKEHMSAYASELGLMVELGVDFNEYHRAIEAL